MSDVKPIAAIAPCEYGEEPKNGPTVGRRVSGTSAIDARDRAYGPFITWEDLRDHGKALDENTLAQAETQRALRISTASHLEIVKSNEAVVESNTKLVRTLELFTDLFSKPPA